jgi:hypothetical protein
MEERKCLQVAGRSAERLQVCDDEEERRRRNRFQAELKVLFEKKKFGAGQTLGPRRKLVGQSAFSKWPPLNRSINTSSRPTCRSQVTHRWAACQVGANSFLQVLVGPQADPADAH